MGRGTERGGKRKTNNFVFQTRHLSATYAPYGRTTTASVHRAMRVRTCEHTATEGRNTVSHCLSDGQEMPASINDVHADGCGGVWCFILTNEYAGCACVDVSGASVCVCWSLCACLPARPRARVPHYARLPCYLHKSVHAFGPCVDGEQIPHAGITRASLVSDSLISAATFQETNDQTPISSPCIKGCLMQR